MPVSTSEQTLGLQFDILCQAGSEQIFIDIVLDKQADKPKLKQRQVYARRHGCYLAKRTAKYLAF